MEVEKNIDFPQKGLPQQPTISFYHYELVWSKGKGI